MAPAPGSEGTAPRRGPWRDSAALGAVYRPLIAALLRATARVFRRVPRRLALALGEGIGLVAFSLARRDRRRALAHLRLAFGRTRSGRELARIARAAARNLGRSLVETMRLPAMTEDEIESLVDADSFAPAEEVLARGRGMIALTAHLGAWEAGGAYLAIRLGKPLHAVARRLYFRPYNDLLVEIRKSAGIEVVYQDRGARPLLDVLRRNGALVVLADQDVPSLDGVFVDFFGRPAWTPTGPAALARASGAGIVPIFMTWKGRRHHLHVLPEVKLVRTHDRQADALKDTRAWSQAIEQVIRRHPEQWVWFHRRWRTRPRAGADGRM